MTARDLRDLLNRYADRSWLSRRYLRLRAAYYPLEAYLSHLPPQGTVIDVGCGYGLLAILLAQARPQLEVRGLDPVEERIRTAAKAARGLDRVKFIIGGWEQLAEQRADAVMLIDMLHHVRKDQHEPLLRAAAAALNPGGVLLVNETDPSTPERWRYWWNYLSDVLLYPLVTRCQFRHPEEIVRLANAAGLTVQASQRVQRFGFATILYACRKPA